MNMSSPLSAHVGHLFIWRGALIRRLAVGCRLLLEGRLSELVRRYNLVPTSLAEG